ncbi:MAG TPA: alpha/beta fold hydrolase [Candidatus Binataceae bacterium]|nr:alpha/beta fold hydrolase [Candidatus Binataceae bacterium]
MKIEESVHSITASDGSAIRVYSWKSPAPVRGVVQIAHGMGEHAQRYRPIAHALVNAGYAVYANDHRGHGELAANAKALGDFGPGGFPSLVDDMTVVTRMARNAEKGKMLVLLGHSMGSFAAQLYVLDHSELLDGVALSGSAALDLLGAAAMSGRWQLEDLNAAFNPARTPFDWLSRDQATVDAYIADPLCGFNVTGESYGSLFSVAPRLAEISEIGGIRKELPVFLFAGDRDPVNANLTWFQPLIDRYREAGLTDVSWHVYGGARHEVLNETNRPEVIANFQAWSDRIMGPT